MSDFVDIDYQPNYLRNKNELEAFAIFSICVAGKNADTTKKALIKFLNKWAQKTQKRTPFNIIKSFKNKKDLAQALKKEGIGCYTLRADYILDLVNSKINLENCNIEDLEKIKGIGPKTARFFVLFSQKNSEQLAVLDVHILRWLKNLGFDVPVNTPGSSKKYKEIEKIFISQYKKYAKNLSLADFDYQLWQQMRMDK